VYTLGQCELVFIKKWQGFKYVRLANLVQGSMAQDQMIPSVLPPLKIYFDNNLYNIIALYIDFVFFNILVIKPFIYGQKQTKAA